MCIIVLYYTKLSQEARLQQPAHNNLLVGEVLSLKCAVYIEPQHQCSNNIVLLCVIIIIILLYSTCYRRVNDVIYRTVYSRESGITYAACRLWGWGRCSRLVLDSISMQSVVRG